MELLERQTYLDELKGLLLQASSGHGHMVFVGGEAGVGKSSLVRAFLDSAELSTRFLVGYCDPISTPGPLGPLLDLGRSSGGALEQVIRASVPRHELFQSLLRDLATNGTSVVVIEDAHWADDATFDLFRYLGRRLSTIPALVIVTYRNDELNPAHPLRHVLGDLATAHTVRRLALRPLSLDSVQILATDSPVDVDELFRMTGGNPFFVTEVLAQGSRRIPESVRDSVLSRCSRLSPNGRAALELAAVIGTTIEPHLLTALPPDLDAFEEGIASGMLVSVGSGIAFRHELVRQAILEFLSPGTKRELNRRVLEALKRAPSGDLALLSHHAAEARDTTAVLEFSVAAARRAAALKSHRESAAQFERALAFSAHEPLEFRAHLFREFAHECYLTDRIDECVDAAESECAIWERLGDTVRSGDALRRLTRAYWTAGRGEDAIGVIRRAIQNLETLPSGPELAMACSTYSQVLMLGGDSAAAIEWGSRAIEMSEQGGEIETLVHALNNVGSARMRSQDAEGVNDLLRSLNLARHHELEDHVARAFVNLAWSYIERYEFNTAHAYLREGIAYTDEHGLESMHRSLRAMESMVLMYHGEWGVATEIARAMAASHERAAFSRMLALLVLGRIAARMGHPDAELQLGRAAELCEGMSEFQRSAIVRVARAEAAWLAGNDRLVNELTVDQVDMAAMRSNRWLAGEFALWRWRTGVTPLPAVDIFEPFALQIAGNVRDAVALWRSLGCPYEAADALACSDDESDLRYAHAEFIRLGAAPAAAMTLRRLRELGVERLPRGPRPATQANPYQLTSREMEILELLVQRQSTQQIAETLFLSPRTVGHHISAILAKLEVRSREEAAWKALQAGIASQSRYPGSPI